MRELEGGKLNRVFIGRHAEREDVKTRLADGERVLLLHGQAMVGKASLARQVAEELQAENKAQGNDSLIVYTVDCKAATDWPDVMKAVCSALSLDESLANENLLLGAVLQHAREAGSGGVMLLLLRLHSLEPHSRHVDELARFLNSLADSDVTTIVTSRRRLNLPSVYQVKPLTDADALRLLSHQARDANPDDFADILKRCHGVPILILQVAKYVSGDPMFAYTADELKQALEEDPALLMRDLGKEAEDLFSRLSREVQGHVSKLAQLLDGTFSMDVLQAALGVEGARAKTVLRRLCDESPLIVDTRSKRMFIEPLVLHHVRQLGHVDADDQARLRVVTLMGRVLTHAEHELYVEGQNTVYGHLHGDWPQLQHLLRQAIHCTDNTYQAYLKVAVESDKLLVKCFPEEAMQFYQNMASAAVRFGTRRDQAVLQGLIGMAVTQGRAGTGWQEALQYFHRALPILRDDDRSINLPRLLCDMGFTYFKLNRLGESHRYLREALEVSEKTEVEDDRQVFLLIRARSLLALPAIFRGQLTAGKRLLEETLELCSQLAPHHPDKPILINSIGLVYERSGESQEMAMDYYLRSLAERRRYAEVAPGDLVPCLNNIGMQYGRRGNYELAFKHLEEAAAIRARSGRWHYYTALTQQHLGQLCLQRGDYKRAESHLLEASEVYARCTPGHDVRGKVALCLAHVYITPPCRDVKNVRKYLTQVCELADASGEDLSDAGLLVAMSAVQHRMQLDGWQARHMCVALEVNSDVREFWREVEKQTESFRKGRSLLLGSKSLKEVIELSEEAEDRQMSRLETARDQIYLQATSMRSDYDADTSAVSTQSPRPEPTLDDVVSCAQQLLTALPSDDPQAAGHVVTADQRRALAKLASLHDVHTQWAGKSLEEQRAALVKIASQRDSDGKPW
nr:hypothetical protein BaRGS_032492 [Batillaria attramentaria]